VWYTEANSKFSFSMRRTRGFTLIEVMVVIALIGIMTAITFVSFSGRRDDEALKASAREVAAALRMTQSDALAGVKEPGNDNGLCFHEAKWEDDHTYGTYIAHLKSGGADCNNPFDLVQDPYKKGDFSLSDGVVFDSSDWVVSFRVPRGDLVGSATQTIVLNKSGKSIAVCILASGSVVETSVETSTCP